LIILAFLIVVPAFGQRRKKADEETGPVYVEGITYALPRVGVRICVEAVEERFVPGPYHAYANQLLGIDNAKTRATVQWKLADLKLEPFAEPDPGHVYKALGEGAFTLSLTPDGRLAGINAGRESASPMKVHTNLFIQKPEKEDDFSFAHFNDTPLFAAGDSTNNYRPVRVSAEKKAAEAAARIFEIRLTRFHLAAGLLDELHPDGSAYNVSLKELNRMEEDYLSLFVGRTTYKKVETSFDFIPDGDEAEKGEVIFRFSEENGLLQASDLSGKPVMMQVDPVKNLKDKYTMQSRSENPAAGESGVYYRMPGLANVQVIFELNTIASARMVLPQYGEIAPVPEELLFGDYFIEFHPETGAVRSVSKK